MTDARRSASLGRFLPALRGTKDEGRGLVYLPPLSENRRAFCSLPVTKPPPVFLPVQAGDKQHRPPLPPSAAPAGITHYTLQARSCAKGVLPPPLETPGFVVVWPQSAFAAHVPTPPKPKEAAQTSLPHGPICAAPLFGLWAGTGDKMQIAFAFSGCIFRQTGL